MTSGASQGLFVIVAVVIFGIFVVISYVLFRDNLKTGLATLFKESLETTKDIQNPKTNVMKHAKVTFRAFNGSIHTFTDITQEALGATIRYSSSSYNKSSGIIIEGSQSFKKGFWYRFSFNVKEISGSLSHIGGHINFSEVGGLINSKNLRINGKKEEGAYYYNGGFQTGKYQTLDGSGNYKVSVDVFVREDGFGSAFSDKGFWIQMERGTEGGVFEVEVSDIQAYQLN